MSTNEQYGIQYIPEIAEEIKAKKYADLMMDWTFKFVFGPSGKYKEGLISLLNSIIPDVNIKSIEYMPTEMLGATAEHKTSVLDLRCIAEDGSRFAVEIQNYKEKGFLQRCIAYASKIFLEQNLKRSEYHKIMPVYVVAIISDKATREMEMYQECKDQILFDHTIIEKNSGIFAPRIISVIFAATGNFNKEIDDCHNDVDKWMFLLKHSTRIMNFSDSFQSEVFKRVLEVLKISSFTPEEFDMYYTEEQLKAIRQAQDEAAIEFGEKRGFEKGKAEGRAEANRENARKLLALGVDINIIVQTTGLTPEEIQTL